MITPHWDGRRWRIQVRHEGRRISFSSSTAGAKGRKECQKKYDNWYYGEATGEKTVERVVQEYLEDLKCRCGEHSGAYIQNECYMRLYITSKVIAGLDDQVTWFAELDATGKDKLR